MPVETVNSPYLNAQEIVPDDKIAMKNLNGFIWGCIMLKIVKYDFNGLLRTRFHNQVSVVVFIKHHIISQMDYHEEEQIFGGWQHFLPFDNTIE